VLSTMYFSVMFYSLPGSPARPREPGCRRCSINKVTAKSTSRRGVGPPTEVKTRFKYPLLRACSSSPPRQPEQVPDYTLMYAHIGRLAILHLSTRTFFCT
jgi:hypothetical protein